MDCTTARILNEETERFYRRHARSFSSTRQTPWAGWQRVADALAAEMPVHEAPVKPAVNSEHAPSTRGTAHAAGTRIPLTVLDLASGNLRFEAFLGEAFPERPLCCYTVDSCEGFEDAPLPLPGQVQRVHQQLDLVGALLDGRLPTALETPPCRLVSCFGFFHHVPGERYRQALLDALLEKAQPGGLVAVSLWRFLNSPELAKRARESTAASLARLEAERGLDARQLEEGDFLLGWQGDLSTVRYCHHFTEGEIDRLAASVAGKAQVAARFDADGRTGNLNAYLLLQKTGSSRFIQG